MGLDAALVGLEGKQPGLHQLAWNQQPGVLQQVWGRGLLGVLSGGWV